MKKKTLLLLVLTFGVLALIGGTIFLASSVKYKRYLQGWMGDLYIQWKTPGQEREIERLSSTPVRFVGAERYGSEEVKLGDSFGERRSFFVGGTIVERGDNWVILDTQMRRVKFAKDKDAICFLETPAWGPEIKGETVTCQTENIPLGGYGLVTAKIAPGDEYAQYVYFLFVKPEDLQFKP